LFAMLAHSLTWPDTSACHSAVGAALRAIPRIAEDRRYHSVVGTHMLSSAITAGIKFKRQTTVLPLIREILLQLSRVSAEPMALMQQLPNITPQNLEELRNCLAPENRISAKKQQQHIRWLLDNAAGEDMGESFISDLPEVARSNSKPKPDGAAEGMISALFQS